MHVLNHVKIRKKKSMNYPSPVVLPTALWGDMIGDSMPSGWGVWGFSLQTATLQNSGHIIM